MDKLEKFIRDNRDQLDKFDPPENGWKQIKKELATGRKIIPFWLPAAAIILIVLGSSIVIYSSFRKNGFESSEKDPVQATLKETEAYYNSLAKSLYHEAKPLLTSHPELTNELNSDMAQLDSMCTDIKKDLKDNVSNQEVIEALIRNYRIKLQMLEDMLIMMKQNENNKDKPNSHEL